MIDHIGNHLSAIKAWTLSLYGMFYFVMALWLIWRGSHERWAQRIPGRVVLGIFLLFACYREWDVAIVLLHYGRTQRASEAGTDWQSVAPLVVGLVFGAWATVRFFRNTVGSSEG